MIEERILRHGSLLLLAGMSFICLVFLTPNVTEATDGTNFFKIATSASWGKWLDVPAIWCSFKIILLSLGLFLVVESTGTILSVLNRKTMALMVYCLHLVPGLGVVFGSYDLIKALL